MHPRVIAERRAKANARILAAAQALGEALGLPEESTQSLAVKSGRLNAEVTRLMEAENMAILLEAILPKVDLLREERNSLGALANVPEPVADPKPKATKAEKKGGK